jgi:uncharacterized phage protein gp47/JayE
MPGLKAVTNPEPSTGGADREGAAQVRVNAPGSIRTFGRAVSIDDYTALALTFPGVTKARAAWIRQPSGVRLTIGTTEGTLAIPSAFATRLHTFLDLRRDANVPLTLASYTPVYLDLAVTIDVDDRYGKHATRQAALYALNPNPNPDGTVGFFGQLGFGQSIHLSSVYALLQDVPGVSRVVVTRFGRVGPQTAPIVDTIPVGATELAVIKNDPGDHDDNFGKLTVDPGKGGFSD